MRVMVSDVRETDTQAALGEVRFRDCGRAKVGDGFRVLIGAYEKLGEDMDLMVM